MRNFIAAFLLTLFSTSAVLGKTVVFWQDGFPTVASQPITRQSLTKALEGMEPVFAGIAGLRDPMTLSGADLLAV